MKKAFPVIAIIITIEIAISFFAGIGQIYANQTAKNLLYFTFGNSNAAGINFSIIILLHVYGIFSWKKWYFKIAHIVPMIFLFYLLYLTRARNALFALLLCFVAFLVFKGVSFKNSKTMEVVAILLMILFPILVSSFYTILATRTNALDIINYLFATPGKTITSRTITWVSAFKHLNGIHIFIGDYHSSTIAAYKLFQTLPGYQNSQIDFFVDEGLVPALLILSFLFICLYHRYKTINKNKIVSFLPVVFWLFTIFSSTFEVGLFICMNIWYIFGFSMMSLGDFSKEGLVVQYEQLYYDLEI